MRLGLLNPNSTAAMTEEMVAAARAVAEPDTEVEGLTAFEAPATIEGYHADAVAAAAVAQIVAENGEHFHAFIIACFGDPGLRAARETMKGPVIGIAEASFMLAIALGHRFAILTNTAADVPEMDELVRQHGFGDRYAGTRPADLGVAEADSDREAAFEGYLRAGQLAIETDGADVLCLGCGPMLGLRDRLEASLQAPIIEGVPAATKVAETLTRLGLETSKVGGFRAREQSTVK